MKKTIKLILLITLVTMAFANVAFAEEIGDEFGGPGIGLNQATYDGSLGTSKIYGYNPIAGFEGAVVSSANVMNNAGPTYVDSTVAVPVNNAAIDMGPTSGYLYGNYSLHSINDAGPGTGVATNQLGNPTYYNIGGPGIGITASSGQTIGPEVNQSMVNPEDYLNMISMLPGEYVFNGGNSAQKVGQ